MFSAHRIVRRLRYGRPVIVVSGLPRSGTSMAMKMLQAGGIPLLTDGRRPADESNPRGYYELEAVQNLHRQAGTPWLTEARGKAVKVVSFLLTWLPETYNYKVIFMERNLDEVIASETAMLIRRGEPIASGRQADTRRLYEQHLENVVRFLAKRRCFSVLMVGYNNALERPELQARRISRFLGGRLNVQEMARVVEPALYRSRR